MSTNARASHSAASVATADPARLLVMLYERLVLDVQQGLEAQQRRDFAETHRQLTHAQDIITELQNSLRADECKGGYDLSALYDFLHRQLVMANIRKDAGITNECLTIVTDLCETWRQAALESTQVKSA